MLISKTCQYAIRALVHINRSTADNQRVGIKQISEATGTPQHFISKILITIVKQGFVNSVKGPGGGFYLNNRTNEITILEVIEAVEGPNYCFQCLLGLPDCSDDNPCPAHFQFTSVREELRNTFEKMTIGQLSQNLDNNLDLFRLS